MTGGVSGVDSTSTQGASNAQYRFLQKYNAGSEYPNVGIGLVPDFDDISFDSYGDNMSAFGAGYVPPQNWQAPQFLGVPQNTAYDPNTMQRTGGYPPASGTVATQTNRTTQMRYGYGPEIEEGMTQAQINKKYEEWEDHLIERQLEKQQKATTAQMQLIGQEDVIADKLAMLNSQINREDQDKIGPAFEALVKSIKDKYLVDGKPPKGISEAQLDQRCRTEARKIYATTYSVNLSDDIDAKGSSAFWQGFKQTFGFGLADKTSKTENIALVEGDKSPQTGAKAGKIVGSVIGWGSAVGGGAAIGAGIGVWFGGVGAVPGAIVGGIIGGIGRLCQGLFS